MQLQSNFKLQNKDSSKFAVSHMYNGSFNIVALNGVIQAFSILLISQIDNFGYYPLNCTQTTVIPI